MTSMYVDFLLLCSGNRVRGAGSPPEDDVSAPAAPHELVFDEDEAAGIKQQHAGRGCQRDRPGQRNNLNRSRPPQSAARVRS
jgi:hypothetical protein